MRKQSRPPRVLLVGGGAREHAIGEALCRHRGAELLVVSHNDNYGLAQIAESFEKWDETDARHITGWAESKRVDMAVIGLEDPLSAGLPDELTKVGIPTVGPCREAARLETSKLFTRDLMRRHGIPGQVDYRYFSDVGQLRDFLNSSHGDFAVKPVGLTAGKGVKVMGVHCRRR
ncbi:MAG: hypothetical protein NTU41_11780 [Chloroflexi bacterium]|nr:hypothetical protein [Chloroflexota bacterium]